jgi:hypothetical protein
MSKIINKPTSPIKDRPAEAKKRPISSISFRLVRSLHDPNSPHKGKAVCGSRPITREADLAIATGAVLLEYDRH